VLLTASPHIFTRGKAYCPATLQVPLVAKPFELDDLLGVVSQAASSLSTSLVAV
jgi:hypothetical protein